MVAGLALTAVTGCATVPGAGPGAPGAAPSPNRPPVTGTPGALHPPGPADPDAPPRTVRAPVDEMLSRLPGPGPERARVQEREPGAGPEARPGRQGPGPGPGAVRSRQLVGPSSASRASRPCVQDTGEERLTAGRRGGRASDCPTGYGS